MRRGVLILAGVLLATIPAAGARAGTFVVHACGTAGANNAWHATVPPPGIMEVNESCQSPWPMQGPWVRDVLASSSGLVDGQGAWLLFDAAPGTQITAITYKRWLWKVAIQELQPALSTGQGVVLETCSIQFGNDRCDLGGDGTPAVSFTGLDTDQLRVGVGCEITPDSFGPTCPGGGTQHGYGAVIYDAAVTIRDDTTPAAPTVAAYGLWSGADWYRRASSVTVSGADPSGIAAVRVYADGQLLAESRPACDYTHPKPCDDAAELTVPIDTTQLSDGAHDIGVTLVDPAGNESPAVTRSVLVANEPPGTPQLTITPSHSSSPTFTVAWSPAAGHVLPIAAAHITVCHDLVCSHTTSTATSVQLTASASGTTTVSVYLEDVGGNVDPDNSASADFLLDAATTTDPPLSDTPSGPTTAPPSSGPRATRVRPWLGLRTRARGASIRVMARIDARAKGSLTLTLRIAGRYHSGRRWSRVMRRRAPIRGGRATMRAPLPHGTKRITALAVFRGTPRLLPASARRTLRLR